MTRQQEFEHVKELIKGNFDRADCGLFDVPNIVGDEMTMMYKGEYLELLICYDHGYFEVFGMTEEEFADLEKCYRGLQDEWLASISEGLA